MGEWSQVTELDSVFMPEDKSKSFANLTLPPALPQSLSMTKEIFVLAGALYWVSFLLRFFLWTRPSPKADSAAAALEKIALLVFTTALVLYINSLQIVNGQVHSETYDRPVSFLLFAWAVGAAQLVTEVAYSNRITSIFANLWIAASLTVSAIAAKLARQIFTSDLEWLSFHRLCFLLGYAFCILAFPLGLSYLRTSLRLRKMDPGEARSTLERSLSRTDRMAYRMVLWALPLLTAGIITEILLMIESHRLNAPEQLWRGNEESLLALTAWFLCGVYLHTRLFFGWKNLRSASLYLAGSVLLMGVHLSHLLLGNSLNSPQ